MATDETITFDEDDLSRFHDTLLELAKVDEIQIEQAMAAVDGVRMFLRFLRDEPHFHYEVYPPPLYVG